MAIDRNVIIRKLAYELMDLGFDLVKGENLRADEVRIFWQNVMSGCATLIGEESPPTESTPAPSFQRKEGSLHDGDRMPWGKHEGELLSDVPDDYWLWFLRQDWCDNWPDLVEYANTIVEDD